MREEREMREELRRGGLGHGGVFRLEQGQSQGQVDQMVSAGLLVQE